MLPVARYIDTEALPQYTVSLLHYIVCNHPRTGLLKIWHAKQ